MDELIKRYDASNDGDLVLCVERGVAYQRDMSKRLGAGINAEGKNYFDHYTAMQGQAIGQAIHQGRIDLVNRHAGADCPVLDIGIGSGEFIRSRPGTFGHDVNPKALEWLKSVERVGSLKDFMAFTFWDVLEHVDVPNNYFRRMADGCHLFTSLPVFEDLTRIRQSKHYKPNEHLYYWTADGFVDWMARYRFRLLERSDFESACGREAIASFAFVRDLPTYHQTIDQYRQLYEPNYGASAYLYFEEIAHQVVRLNPSSIIDYGCGRSDLAAHFWNDGARKIAKYDPAIAQFQHMPDGQFELALCTDVMEHILMGDVERVLAEMRGKARHALFTISLKPARKRLPDGRNAHVTLLSAAEWTRWIKGVFGSAIRIPTQWDHILMLKTF